MHFALAIACSLCIMHSMNRSRQMHTKVGSLRLARTPAGGFAVMQFTAEGFGIWDILSFHATKAEAEQARTQKWSDDLHARAKAAAA